MARPVYQLPRIATQLFLVLRRRLVADIQDIEVVLHHKISR